MTGASKWISREVTPTLYPLTYGNLARDELPDCMALIDVCQQPFYPKKVVDKLIYFLLNIGFRRLHLSYCSARKMTD
jgi:hypothetical protein